MPRSPGEPEALGLLGLAHRAGMVVFGVAETRRALQGGDLGLVIFAEDASPTQLEKLRGRLRHESVPVRWASGRAALGRAVGGGPVSAVGVRRGGFIPRLLGSLPEAGLPRSEEAESHEVEKKESTGSGHAGC